MRSAREYRIFRPPAPPSRSCKTGPQRLWGSETAAISQYQWYKLWMFANLPEAEAHEIAQIFHGVDLI